jgi:hypothetical protein
MTANDNMSSAVRRRSSRKRQRGRNLSVPVTPAECLAIDDRARAAGLSRASFLRACALGTPGPRARRRPSVEIEALARAVTALNKAGGLLNQAVRQLNIGGSIGLAHSSFAALNDTRAAVSQILQIVGRVER